MNNLKKVIVTGGYGFIGSNLIKHLVKKKYFVINIDKISYSSNLYNLKNLNKKNYKFFKENITNQKFIFKILKKFEPSIFFNLAAETHVDRSIDDPYPFLESNILGVHSILEAIRKYIKLKKKIKLIHVSTDEVYGDFNKSNLRANEKSNYRPSSPYAASKASADHLIKAYIRTYKFPAIISNCSNNYGPNQFPEKLIPKIIFNALNNKQIPIYGNGLNSREWIYVEDHCRALELLSRKGKIGENYNIGSGIDLTNLKLTNIILKIIRKKISLGNKVKINYVSDRPGHDIRYAINSKKIKDKLNWKIITNFNSGISKTIDWYLNNKNYFKKIDKKNYIKRIGLSK